MAPPPKQKNKRFVKDNPLVFLLPAVCALADAELFASVVPGSGSAGRALRPVPSLASPAMFYAAALTVTQWLRCHSSAARKPAFSADNYPALQQLAPAIDRWYEALDPNCYKHIGSGGGGDGGVGGSGGGDGDDGDDDDGRGGGGCEPDRAALAAVSWGCERVSRLQLGAARAASKSPCLTGHMLRSYGGGASASTSAADFARAAAKAARKLQTSVILKGGSASR